jgi:hypothetical protein
MLHIDVERLRALAQSDDLNLNFTQDELDHLSICADCLRAYFEAIVDEESPDIEGGQLGPAKKIRILPISLKIVASFRQLMPSSISTSRKRPTRF